MHNRLSDEQIEYEYLLHHVVLSRVLPERYPRNQESLELKLLSRIVKTLKNCSEWIPPVTVNFFQRLQRTHENRIPENVAKEINELRPGETFGMFIYMQNTALMIHMPQEQSNFNGIEAVNIATFPGNVNLKEIYKQNDSSDFMVRQIYYIIKEFNLNRIDFVLKIHRSPIHLRH